MELSPEISYDFCPKEFKRIIAAIIWKLRKDFPKTCAQLSAIVNECVKIKTVPKNKAYEAAVLIQLARNDILVKREAKKVRCKRMANHPKKLDSLQKQVRKRRHLLSTYRKVGRIFRKRSSEKTISKYNQRLIEMFEQQKKELEHLVQHPDVPAQVKIFKRCEMYEQDLCGEWAFKECQLCGIWLCREWFSCDTAVRCTQCE